MSQLKIKIPFSLVHKVLANQNNYDYGIFILNLEKTYPNLKFIFENISIINQNITYRVVAENEEHLTHFLLINDFEIE